MSEKASGAFGYEGRTLDRFEELRQGWARNGPLRTLYAYWFAEIGDVLAPVLPGSIFELGSGPGFARQFLPGVRTSDLVRSKEHDCQIDATAPWPFQNASLDGVLLFDVLHHLSAPTVLFSEASRVLRPGGRLVMMEPYVSLLSYPFYRFLHVEGLDTRVDPWALDAPAEKDPFAGNQVLPRLIFDRRPDHFRDRFPHLCAVERRLYSGLSYVASGGFGHPPIVPDSVWSSLYRLDRWLPRGMLPLVAFRMLICLERVQDCGSSRIDVTRAAAGNGPSVSVRSPAAQ